MFYVHVILQYLHVYMIFAAFIEQNLAQRFVKRGSDLYNSFAPQMLGIFDTSKI